MNFRYLAYFMAVAEELHMGRAAERLGIAQPPLSRQIKQFETELGVLLFHRGRNGISLTQAGQRLHERGLQIESLVRDTEREVSRIGQGMEGRIRVGYVGSAVYGILPNVVKSFRAHFPEVELALLPMNNDRLKAGLIRREIDLAIARPELHDSEILSRPLMSEELILCAPDTLFPGRQIIAPKEISGQLLVLYPEFPRPSFADQVLQSCAAHGINTDRVLFTMDVNTAIGLVAVGEGLAIVPQSVGSMQRNGIRFHSFGPSIGKTGVSINHRIDDQGIHVKNFVTIARNVARAL
ncbi:LysR substrate-binding domain-containing protein [Pseudogemmobacter faecipullorum]|uniref:LysR family transcriptional regulator n=1 Tax=Pseudogemmobacter faecipullorum TaxID=2755041 RepID=A0ABS8CNG5_9RHOB|nr:LysR substrate-binding domain-containing protein [Pseudogemmobacter faecipullorum]MCB5410918.1 LysR family transcriptional regulator [Pseudogemmobacter faecipullorum]